MAVTTDLTEQEEFIATLEDDPAPEPAAQEEEWYTAEQVAELRKQERESAAEEARQVAEAQFNERRGAIDKNHNAALDAIRAAGMDWNPKTGLAYVNPAAALQQMLGAAPQQTQAKAEPPQVEAYDPESIKAYTAEVARQTRAEVLAEVKPLLDSLANGQANIMLPGALGQAASFVASRGYTGAENTPEFKEAFRSGYSSLSLEQRSDPAVIRLIAGGAFASVPDDVLEKVRQDGEKGRQEAAAQAERDRQRAAMGFSQTQGQPGRAATLVDLQNEQKQGVLQRFFDGAEGLTQEQRDTARALVAGKLPNGQHAYDLLQAKRAKQKAGK